MLKKQLPWVFGAFFVLALVSPVANAKHWVMLGTAHVDKSEDHKTIHVGSEAGQFHSIQLRVSGGPVEFSAGDRALWGRVKGGACGCRASSLRRKTRELNLPGERRT